MRHLSRLPFSCLFISCRLKSAVTPFRAKMLRDMMRARERQHIANITRYRADYAAIDDIDYLFR